MRINSFYDSAPKVYSLLDIMEGKKSINSPVLQDLPDSFIKNASKAYDELKEKNKKISLDHIFAPSKKYIQQFLSLPNYGDYILPFLTEKKPADLAYLYKLASMKDKNKEIRIPGVCFPYFSEIPAERLKILEPIITSKNYLGNWNYSASFIEHLDFYSDKQLELMAKFAKVKFNGYDMMQIVTSPLIMDSEKILNKAEIINKLYGKRLMESGLFADDNKLYIRAKIGLSEDNKINNPENYKEIYANIDLNTTPINSSQKENLDLIVNSMSKNIESKLSIFTEQDLNRVALNIHNEMPDVTKDELLIVMQKLTQFANYSSLQNISKELQKLNIGKIPIIGDINPIFNYLCDSKKLCPLSNDIDSNYAFFITKKDLDDKKEMNFLRQWLKRGELKNIKFINLEGWSDGVNLLSDDKILEEKTKRVLTKAKKLIAKNKYMTFREAVNRVLNNHIETTLKDLGANVITISNDSPASKSIILEQMKPNYPSTDILKSTIEAIAQNYTNNEKAQKTLSEGLAKYFDTNLNVYSKQSIIDNMKIIHSKINDFLYENNLPQENVYLVTPSKYFTRKSFELITKMYTDLYNIPEEKIIQVENIGELNKFPKNSTFVVLDDIVGTGKSMSSIGKYAFYGKSVDTDKHILFAPISGTDFGIAYIRNIISSLNRQENDKVIYIDTNIKQPTSLKKVFGIFYHNVNKPLKYNYGTEGYENSSQCIAFPYMTPDNNSVIANDITKYFVANYKCIKNPNTDLLKIEQNAYRTSIFGKTKDNK